MNYLSKKFTESMVDRAKARDAMRRETEVKRRPSKLSPLKTGEIRNDANK